MATISVGDLVYMHSDDIICDEQRIIGIVVAWHAEMQLYRVLIHDQIYWFKNEFLRGLK